MAPDPPGFFPPARSLPPLTAPHRSTIILLHGRGLSAHTFGPDLVATTFPSSPSSSSSSCSSTTTTTLRALYPHAKLVFPLAPRHRATIYARSVIHQWFDSWHLDASHLPCDAEEWRAIPGLRDTVAHLHGVIRDEAALVGGTRNVALGGLSQGCAASLVALLLWEGEALAGFWGMCGWLVFERVVEGVVLGQGEGVGPGEDRGFDPFERAEEDGEAEETVGMEARVVRVLREMLELDGNASPVVARPRAFDTPVFLGHGVLDDKVPVVRGKAAAEWLGAAGLDTEWREYLDLGHWYSPEMLTDMTTFLTHRTGWGRDEKSS